MTSKLQEEKFLIKTLPYIKNWSLYIVFRNLQIQDCFRVLFRDPINCSFLGGFLSYRCLHQCSETVHRTGWKTHWEKKEKHREKKKQRCPINVPLPGKHLPQLSPVPEYEGERGVSIFFTKYDLKGWNFVNKLGWVFGSRMFSSSSKLSSICS